MPVIKSHVRSEQMKRKNVSTYAGIVIFISILLSIVIGYFLPRKSYNRGQPYIPLSGRSTKTLVPSPQSSVTAIPSATEGMGIGILGDSNSDEYRADDKRGGEYADTTLNWMEQLVKDRGLNFGPWGHWGGARRTGYEYNWAHSGAKVHTMITSGQHTGLARQVAEGKVSLVFMWIGDNDFHLINGTYEQIYSGKMSDSDVQAKVDQMIADITTAVDTVLKAGPVKMVVVTISDKGVAPQAMLLFPDPRKRKRVSDAIEKVNAGIENLAATRGITVVDVNSFAKMVLGRLNSHGAIQVGDQSISILHQGDEPHHFQLADKSGHPGTVLSGLAANALFVEPVDKAFGLDIKPLTDQEILANAGIQ